MIPDDLWEKVSDYSEQILCASCIIEKLESFNQFECLTTCNLKCKKFEGYKGY